LHTAFFEALSKINIAELKGSVINLKSGENKLFVLTEKKNFMSPSVAVDSKATQNGSSAPTINRDLDPDLIVAMQGILFTCDAMYGQPFALENALKIMWHDPRGKEAMIVTMCNKRTANLLTDRKHMLAFKPGVAEDKIMPDCNEEESVLDMLELLWQTQSFTYGTEGLFFYNSQGKEILHFVAGGDR
jgi:hypothetical protein